MAIIESGPLLENENTANTKNPRELCEYKHTLVWSADKDDETFVEWKILEEDGLPKGLTLDGATGIISGVVIPLDTYQAVKDYLGAGFDPTKPIIKPGKFTGNGIDGAGYSDKGMRIYHKENPGGDLTTFVFTVELTTIWIDRVLVIPEPEEEPLESEEPLEPAEPEEIEIEITEITIKECKIKVVPNADPSTFILVYGADHDNLFDDDGNKLSPKEYLDWRKSQGFDLEVKCK